MTPATHRPHLLDLKHAPILLLLALGALLARGDDSVKRGEYVVNLLNCGYCHTPGALQGNPDLTRPLAGSNTGIAYTPARSPDRPGIVFARNLTPDKKTGLGRWSDEEIERVIRSGMDRHGRQQVPVMPWAGYAYLEQDDVTAVVAYLRSLEPVKFQTPDNIEEGKRSKYPWIRFGVYVFGPDGNIAEQIHGNAR